MKIVMGVCFCCCTQYREEQYHAEEDMYNERSRPRSREYLRVSPPTTSRSVNIQLGFPIRSFAYPVLFLLLSPSDHHLFLWMETCYDEGRKRKNRPHLEQIVDRRSSSIARRALQSLRGDALFVGCCKRWIMRTRALSPVAVRPLWQPVGPLELGGGWSELCR